mgnify:CR=1 FL=1|jgi:hypothetical protein
MMGLYDLMDDAMATELGVDLNTYIHIIEDVCTLEEADFIIDNIWQEHGDIDAAKQLFNSKLNV